MSTLGRSERDYIFRKTTLDMLRRLEEETGVSPGLIENGGVFVSSTKVKDSLDFGDHYNPYVLGSVSTFWYTLQLPHG